ncbi:hypothetical protein HOLleu_23426 [Holothuria leucospilota]|uniref:Sushi domain-containing protein n=1 Tax=Holothuria leucospilota TaxID=206669 RepID=A0A9Q1BV59_HOLLE|nr:hypothetical protein HOLleu_23426 [Holothuria leucospilota]
MSFAFLVAVAVIVNLVAGNDFQFTGCFLYPSNHSSIQWGWYEHRNLSSSTCEKDCQIKHNITSFFALARRSLCLCDSNVENFEAEGRVEDERCRSHCINSSDKTEYCGYDGVLALYTVHPLMKCVNLTELTNGSIIYERTTVKFKCDKGYVISGNDSLICQRVKGLWKWSAPQPYCKVNSEENHSNLPVTPVLGFKTLIIITTIGVAFGVLAFLSKRKHVCLCPSPFSSYRRGNLPTVTVQANAVIYSNELTLHKPPPVPPREFNNPIEKDTQGTIYPFVETQVTSMQISNVENTVRRVMQDNDNENSEKAEDDISPRISSNYVRPNSHPKDSSISDEDQEYEWASQKGKVSDADRQGEISVQVKPPILPRSNKMHCSHFVSPKYTKVKKGGESIDTPALTSNKDNDNEDTPPHCQVYLDVL